MHQSSSSALPHFLSTSILSWRSYWPVMPLCTALGQYLLTGCLMERPVGYASRTLTKMEQEYSQIEKEGLACVYEVNKFRSYLYGHHFSLITKHKPLHSL